MAQSARAYMCMIGTHCPHKKGMRIERGDKSKGVIYIEERPSLEWHKSKGVMKKDTVTEIGSAWSECEEE